MRFPPFSPRASHRLPAAFEAPPLPVSGPISASVCRPQPVPGPGPFHPAAAASLSDANLLTPRLCLNSLNAARGSKKPCRHPHGAARPRAPGGSTGPFCPQPRPPSLRQAAQLFWFLENSPVTLSPAWNILLSVHLTIFYSPSDRRAEATSSREPYFSFPPFLKHVFYLF